MLLYVTYWSGRLEPIVPATIFAITTVCIAWLLVEIPALAHLRARILTASLILFGSFLIVSAANLFVFEPLHLHNFTYKYKPHPDLGDYLANYLFLGVGVIFGHKLRHSGAASRALGTIGMLVFSTIILGEICGLVWR